MDRYFFCFLPNPKSFCTFIIMKEIIDLCKESGLSLLLGIGVGFIAKSQTILNFIKEIRSMFFNKKEPTIDVNSSYFVTSLNGRFGFSFLEFKVWDKVIPMNGDGCSFADRVDPLIQYSVSASFAPGYEYDTFHQEVDDLIITHRKFTRKFRLRQSRRMSVKLIDLSENKIVTTGEETAWRLVYNFREGGHRMTATEIFTIYRGVRFSFRFQSPRKKYQALIPLINHLLSEYYILHMESEKYAERYQ